MSICDCITVIDRGNGLMHGTPAEVQASPAVRQAYLGTFAQAGAGLASH